MKKTYFCAFQSHLLFTVILWGRYPYTLLPTHLKLQENYNENYFEVEVSQMQFDHFSSAHHMQ